VCDDRPVLDAADHAQPGPRLLRVGQGRQHRIRQARARHGNGGFRHRRQRAGALARGHRKRRETSALVREHGLQPRRRSGRTGPQAALRQTQAGPL
ncbi:hypothetical protein XPN_2504, partial [Xanthomonas arboricola pv. pruni MAFF 301427]